MVRPPEPPRKGGSDEFVDAIDAALRRERGSDPAARADATFDAVLRDRPGAEGRASTPSRQGRAWIWFSLVAALLVAGTAWFLYQPYVVDIRSTPEGAAVTIDGTPAGRTPATLKFRSQPSQVRLELSGYESVEAPLTFSGSTRALLNVALPRLVRIESEPAGAAVLIDEIGTGLVTPATVSIKEPYPGKVELRLDGYAVAGVPVTRAMVREGRSSTTLERLPPPDTRTMVALSGSYPFAVAGCGVEAAAAESHTVRVQAPCALRLSAPDVLLDVTRDIEDAPGARVEIAVPPVVNVQLRSRYENCELSVNGRAIGTPPVDVKVAEGRYSATLRCPNGRTLKTTPFEIAVGQSVRRVDDFLP
jgi:hypothetical protein